MREYGHSLSIEIGIDLHILTTAKFYCYDKDRVGILRKLMDRLTR